MAVLIILALVAVAITATMGTLAGFILALVVLNRLATPKT